MRILIWRRWRLIYHKKTLMMLLSTIPWRNLVNKERHRLLIFLTHLRSQTRELDSTNRTRAYLSLFSCSNWSGSISYQFTGDALNLKVKAFLLSGPNVPIQLLSNIVIHRSLSGAQFLAFTSKCCPSYGFERIIEISP